MYQSIILCFLFLSYPFWGLAQQSNPPCGLSASSDALLMQRLRHNKVSLEENPANGRSAVASYIPVVMHLVREDVNVGGATPQAIFQQLCSVNDFFANQASNLQFYLQDINVINDAEAYFFHFDPDGKKVLEDNRVDQVINVFIVEDASSSDQTGEGITLGYYSSANDWIVIRRDEINGTSETLAHEIGHFFSLPHPFRGWDFEPYDPAVHGTQVGDFSPSINFSATIPNELQDGSNCENAGDEICDTPPDYNHAGIDWACNYQGGAQDPSGSLIDPDEKNVMAYFVSCENKGFSSTQKDLMGIDLFNRILEETLVKGSANEEGPLGNQPNLVQPGNNTNQVDFTTLDFEWEAVENAQGYLFEIDDSPNFTFDVVMRLTDQNNLSLSSDFFEDNTRYYWRVKAYNANNTCDPWGVVYSFTSNMLTNTLMPIAQDGIHVSPNPVISNTAFQLSTTDQRVSFSQYKILDLKGQLLREAVLEHPMNGATSVMISTEGLAPGVYIISVQNEQYQWQEKLLVY